MISSFAKDRPLTGNILKQEGICMMKHMKAFLAVLLAAAAVLCCAGSQAAGGTGKRLMPLVSIRTVTPGEGTRFVTEPVKGNVSAAIASWTPGYTIPPEPYYVDCAVSYTGTDGITSVDSMPAVFPAVRKPVSRS